MEYNVFNALGKEERLQIVELLRKHPYSVNEVASLLNLRQPHVSKELKVLADVGIVNVTKDKQTHVYSLSSRKFAEIETWAQALRKIWEQRLDRLDEVLKKEVKKNGKHK